MLKLYTVPLSTLGLLVALTLTFAQTTLTQTMCYTYDRNTLLPIRNSTVDPIICQYKYTELFCLMDLIENQKQNVLELRNFLNLCMLLQYFVV